MKYKSGEDFLDKLYQNLHLSPAVMKTAEKSDSKEQKIAKYLDRLERVHDMAKDNTHKMEVLKKFYYDKYVIKELPESYIASIKRQNEERGEKDKAINEEALLKKVREDQKNSLDLWLDYFLENDANYPNWFKFYAFNGMLKLNSLNKKQENFGKRSKSTTEFYVELSPEALAKVFDTLNDEIKGKELTDEQVQALENGESFAKLYTFYLEKQGIFQKDEETVGQWVKYDWYSDYYPLWQSLQGKYTNWCTAGRATAKEHLKTGDFYVYYTKDKNGEYKNPRIAIRMYGENEIFEVRGVGPNQNLESNMLDIAEAKLKTFKDYSRFKQRLEDMKYLTELQKKQLKGIEFTKEDIAFLYEIDHTIRGFGYLKDPRLKDIQSKRNREKDLLYYFDCQKENIATTKKDLESGNIIIYDGNLATKNIVNLENLKTIKMITGALDYSEDDPKYLSSLICVGDSALLRNIKTSKGLESLSTINGSAYFNELEDVGHFESLKSVGEYVLVPNFSDNYMESEEFTSLVIKEREKNLETTKKMK